MGAAFLWGTTGVIGKTAYANTNIGPISLAWYRLIFAIPILTLLVVARRTKISLSKREVVLFAGFGLISLTVFEALYFTSFEYTTVQHAAALLYTAPAFVAILSWLILRERMTKGKLAAVGLSILGAFLIMGLTRSQQIFGSRTQIGDWLALGSGLAYSSWYIFGKVLGRKRDPAVTSLLALSFGAVFLFPLMIGLEGLRVPQSLLAWELLAMIGILPTTAAYLLYLGGLRFIDATRASVVAIVEPVSAAMFGYVFFQEMLSYDSLIGFLLIISSIILVSKSKNQAN